MRLIENSATGCYLLGIETTQTGSVSDIEEGLIDEYEEYEYNNDKGVISTKSVKTIKADLYPTATMLTYSVTSKEKNYEEWLDLAELTPGGTVCGTIRNKGKDTEYWVYYCCVPLKPWELV